MHRFVTRSAAKKQFAVCREIQSIEGLVYVRMRAHSAGWYVHDNNLVGAVSAMKDRDETSRRMHGDIDWEVAQFHLPSDRPQRPLVRKQDGAVGLFARQGGPRCDACAGRWRG